MLAEIINVTKQYKVARRQTVTAIQDLSYSIKPGSVTGIVGPNGSGKSTSIKCLLGLIFPNAGQVRLFDSHPSNAQVFKRIGYLPENIALSDTLKSHEILGYHAAMHGIKGEKKHKRIEEMLELVGLTSHTGKTVRQYSKGMMQRLAFAAALLHDPEFIILDEPMSGLDPIGRRFITDLLAAQHKAGKTICFSSHILHDVETLCDQLVVIYQGRLVFEGQLSDFLHKASGYRLVFSAPNGVSDWMSNPLQLGPQTWAITGEYDEVLTAANRLRDSQCEIIEFGRAGTLESSFFDLVKS